ncbi:TetR family transcriptional regulator [Pimelobacter simplex]|uniref:Transcriptional regulator, MerR family n=1 Tax=Nocardioides simplex TaxID=2045 RepID=A0A0A1DKI2_NOCSI|nr:TetR/AcrR family transcriptional regulator [Pimelobacter simplex]AIY15875.1 transcriptional regulator, MerR family [Pimelobacter simplex]MCG8154521.1 TetR family transcriptional regulator [Pimelobacter simplex]GEB12570.1 TetR family transcriptional regulator [Pimelobacter simplex]SFM93167.1 transcriptional regulator, TetR family [Pimelobacter simplex]
MTVDEQTRTEGPRSKRRMILDAAIDNFGGVGFEHTKWATIADEVGIGQTALYHYFESKVHCLLTIMSNELERSLERTRAVTAEVSDPDEQIRVAVAAAFDVTPREALQERILMSHQDLLVGERSSKREEAERERARELVREIEHEWAALLKAGMDAEVFARHDEVVLARLMLGMINSVWRWYRPKGAHTLAEISEQVVAACVRLAH